MVDPIELTYDIAGNAVSLALPGTLWALWFLFAFEHDAFARSVGFGRKTFWLLLPGSLLASLTLLPLAPVTDDWLAISFAGAVFPLFVVALAFEKFAPSWGRSLALFVAALIALGAVLLALVLPFADPIASALSAALRIPFGGGQDVGVALVSVLAAALAVAWSLTRGGVALRLGFLFTLTAAVVAVTFAASISIPGVGIAENFPTYLLPPIGAGIVAVAFASRVFPGSEGLALPVAFSASTLGVVIGADVLRQPPLYNGGPAGLYTIGGAGVLDLVYLSGLLGLLSAYATHRLLRRGVTPVGGPTPEPPLTPTARLVRAFRFGTDRRIAESLVDSSQASRDAALQAGRLLGVPPPPADRPWQGLPVPGWIVSDDANLAAAARAGVTDGAEGYRGWLTARWLVQVGQELGAPRFGSPGRRAVGFGIDLLVVGLPAVIVWSAIVLAIPGSLTSVVGNVGFTAAAYGFIALAFLYLVLAETLTGTTLGKRAVNLEVRDRTLGRPGFLSFLLRNVSLLPPLTLVGIGIPVAIAFLLKPSGIARVTLVGISLPGGLLAFAATLGFVAGGIALLGSLGVLVIALTSERQRLGDVLAGTWVVRAATPPAPAPPPGAGPSG